MLTGQGQSRQLTLLLCVFNAGLILSGSVTYSHPRTQTCSLCQYRSLSLWAEKEKETGKKKKAHHF